MKGVVIGGAGVFGSRLSEMLIRDGHDVVIAGRGVATQRVAAALGAGALMLDRSGDLTPLWQTTPDVVVDAAGPFHAYGQDPHRLPRAAIEHGVHYLDLSDVAEFCAGITTLDSEARAAGVIVLSGISTVPAISSSVAAALTLKADSIDTIDSAILPGNRAPRGRSVVASILHQCGRPFALTLDGQSVQVRGWSRPDRYRLSSRVRRKGWMIAVPDQHLLPQAFGARSVLFRAGLELGVMNHVLALFSVLRGRWPFALPDWMIGMVFRLAELFKPFGSDTGGMAVRVTYARDGAWRRAVWRLFVAGGDGPYVPGVPVRAALRDLAALPAGAGPAVKCLPMESLTAAMADLRASVEQLDTPLVPLFAEFVPDFADLPQAVRALHDVPGPRIWAGRANVTRGTGLWPRLLAGLFGFPRASSDMPVTVTMIPRDGGEIWERRFAGKTFRSFLMVQGDRMTERFGPLTFALDLHVADRRLHYPVRAGRIGPVPLPRWMLPVSLASEFEKDGRFHFDVQLRAPLTGALMVHYQGWLERGSGLGD